MLRGLAAIGGVIATADADRAQRIDQQLDGGIYANGEWAVKIGDAEFAVSLEEDSITVDGEQVEVSFDYTPGDRMVDVELGDEAMTLPCCWREPAPVTRSRPAVRRRTCVSCPRGSRISPIA